MPSPAQLDEVALDYYRFHRRRFQVLLAKARACVGRIGSANLHMLDVGPGFQTQLLQREFPQARVDTLGFEDVRFREGVRGSHYQFDLNRCGERAARPGVPPQDLVVMAEVLEHLQAPPGEVLECAASWLRPGGELLLQTPNAVSLPKRLRMLRGYNPFMLPRPAGDISGHVREYTAGELVELGQAAGLIVQEVAIVNYFGHVDWKGTLYRRMGWMLPPRLRDGITITYRNPA